MRRSIIGCAIALYLFSPSLFAQDNAHTWAVKVAEGAAQSTLSAAEIQQTPPAAVESLVGTWKGWHLFGNGGKTPRLQSFYPNGTCFEAVLSVRGTWRQSGTKIAIQWEGGRNGSEVGTISSGKYTVSGVGRNGNHYTQELIRQ